MFTSEKKEYFTVPPLTFRQEVILSLCQNPQIVYTTASLTIEQEVRELIALADEIVRKAE